MATTAPRGWGFEPARRAGLFAVTAALLAGCTPRPSAPALTDEPVYQNEQEGFRFLAPDGWKQQARSNLPPGKTAEERRLVEYQRPPAGKPATFEVSLVDLPEDTSLATYLGRRWSRSDQARLKSGPDKLDVGGAPAVRLAFALRREGDDLTREVTAFRRGERVYFFTGTFPARDPAARDQVRRAVASVVWRR